MDVDESAGNPDADNAAALVGRSFGTGGNPLYQNITSAAMSTTAGIYYNQNQSGQSFTTTVNGVS